MVSDFKWRTGFGWSAVLVLICSSVTAVILTGVARLLALAAVLVVGTYIVNQYRQWNGGGWRQVHFRAIYAYSAIARHEHAAARNAGTDFDSQRACSRLALLLRGEGTTPAVDDTVSKLASQQGAFLAELVERHSEEVLPGAALERQAEMMARLRGLRLGPQLVIASVVQRRYGEIEAARYAVALATGAAE